MHTMDTLAFEKTHDFSRSNTNTTWCNSKLKKREIGGEKQTQKINLCIQSKTLGFKNGISGHCKQPERLFLIGALSLIQKVTSS